MTTGPAAGRRHWRQAGARPLPARTRQPIGHRAAGRARLGGQKQLGALSAPASRSDPRRISNLVGAKLNRRVWAPGRQGARAAWRLGDSEARQVGADSGAPNGLNENGEAPPESGLVSRDRLAKVTDSLCARAPATRSTCLTNKHNGTARSQTDGKITGQRQSPGAPFSWPCLSGAPKSIWPQAGASGH